MTVVKAGILRVIRLSIMWLNSLNTANSGVVSSVYYYTNIKAIALPFVFFPSQTLRSSLQRIFPLPFPNIPLSEMGGSQLENIDWTLDWTLLDFIKRS